MQSRFLAAAVAVCCSLPFIASAPASADSPHLGVELAVFGPSGPVACPATFTFLGKLYASNWPPGPHVVKYRFRRSDGATGPTEVATYGPHDDTAPLRTTWTLGLTYSGWEQVEVLYPRREAFARVPFTLICSSSSLRFNRGFSSPYRLKTMFTVPNSLGVPQNGYRLHN